MNTKVAVIGVYFGNWPKYFDLFKHTAFFNESYHWYIFTDQVRVAVQENNITFIPCTLSSYNERLSTVFNTAIDIKERNRICECRPAFAKIFEEHVQDYDWWGWTDLDLLNGNFNNFLNDDIFDSYDAVNVTVSTIHPGRVAFNGPIMLLSMRLKYLYKEIANYESMLITGNPQGRHNSFNIEEKDFCDVFFKNRFKLYQGRQVGGHLVPIIRYGKRKLPSRWVNGSMEVQSIREDYPPSYVDAYGCDTMIYHLPKKYNNIVFENGIIQIT